MEDPNVDVWRLSAKQGCAFVESRSGVGQGAETVPLGKDAGHEGSTPCAAFRHIGAQVDGQAEMPAVWEREGDHGDTAKHRRVP
jgi:hypothetical protein